MQIRTALKSYTNKINVHFKVTNLSYKLRHTKIALNYFEQIKYILTNSESKLIELAKNDQSLTVRDLAIKALKRSYNKTI